MEAIKYDIEDYIKTPDLKECSFYFENMMFAGSGLKINGSITVGQFVIMGRNVTLEDGVKIGHHAVIGNNTTIGKDTVLKQHVVTAEHTRIGKNCFLGPGTTTIRDQTPDGKGPEISDNTFIGAQCLIYRSIKADKVIIGAKSLINREIKESGLYYGVPARKRG